jgi:hypothetical protein
MSERPPTSQFRKAIPPRVKLQVALRQGFGVKESDINWSHEPALADRDWDDEKGDTKPGQHDPDYIFVRAKSEHDRITYRDNGTGRGDLQMVAHTKRVKRKQVAHVARMEVKNTGEPMPPKRKRTIPSRPFSKDRRQLQSRNNFEGRRPWK